MPALALFLRGLFQGQLAFLAGMFEKRVALRLAWVTLAITLIGTLFSVVNGLLAGLSALFPSWVSVAASWVVPSNFSACVTAWLATYVAIYVFQWKMRIASMYRY